MTSWTRRSACLFFTATLLLAGAEPTWSQDQTSRHWSATWASAQLRAEGDDALPLDRDGITLRQIVRASVAGDAVRVRLSNTFGDQPLTIGPVSVGRARAPGNDSLGLSPPRAALFNGQTTVIIPAGAEMTSDPVDLPVTGGGDLAISVYLPDVPERQTGHPGARATTYIASGDQTAQSTLEGGQPTTRWYFLSGVDVATVTRARVIALVGDSITDGYGVTPDSNGRWSDHLAKRLRDPGSDGLHAVINLGIGGNRLVRDGLGPNALARFDRDVLAQPGLTHVVVLEGVNDLGVLTRDGPVSPDAHASLVAELTGAYAQMVRRGRDRGVKVIGATIMPFQSSGYYHPPAETEADRQAINAWIRTPGNFDGVIDFDAIARDPANPARLRAEVDSGDGLHPSMAGYQIMGEFVPLEVFQ